MTRTEKLTLLLNFGNDDLSNVEILHDGIIWNIKLLRTHMLTGDDYELRIKEQK